MKPIELAERGLIPAAIIRAGIRRLSRQRLTQESADDATVVAARKRALIKRLADGIIADATEAANEQHYTLPPAFFELVLGPHLKYSASDWTGVDDLADAERQTLETYLDRAQLRDGQRVLDLGCGWGSLSLFIAERFPNSQITGLSNSADQRAWILARAAARDIANLEIITADINDWQPHTQFDRIVSVEMLEHVRNHPAVFAKLSPALNDDGLFFAHIFCHREAFYLYEDEGKDDWMSRYYFTGGVMPSADLFLHYQHDLLVQDRWLMSGNQYLHTANAWLQRLESNRDAVMRIFAPVYEEPERWYQRWRLFFMACAEMFGLDDGKQWQIAHYLWSPRR